MTRKILLLAGYLLSWISGQAQNDNQLLHDFREDWMIYADGTYKKFDRQDVQVVYFTIDGSKYKGDWLTISDDKPVGIFINQKLIADQPGGQIELSVDSLSRLYGNQLSVSLFQRTGISSLSSGVFSRVTELTAFDLNPIRRTGNYFLDFTLTTVLLLSFYFVFLVSTHPRLTLDYLNASKLLSIQEREGNLQAVRITARVNLLFYLFCSLSCALMLIVIFHQGGDRISLSYYFPMQTTGQAFLQWLKLSGIIIVFLFLKLVLVFLISRLFSLRETASVQYAHFIRALFLAIGLMTLISIGNFVLRGSDIHLAAPLLKIGAGVLILSVVTMYLKLLGLTRYHFFHLFSYLCATEIIPLVILLKVLLY